MSGWRAAVVAVLVGGLVLGAGWLIPRLGDDDGTGTTTPRATGVTLACSPSLTAMCQELGPALGTTITDYTAGSRLATDMVVLAPRGDVPAEEGSGAAIGRSPIAIAIWRERALALEGHCGGTIDLSCIDGALGSAWGDLGGSEGWGPFKLGVADPTATTAGLAAWAVLAPGGQAADGLGASLRLQATDAGALMLEMTQFGDSRADAAVAPEVAIAAQLDNAPGRGGRLEVRYPVAGPWIEFVAVARGRDAERVAGRLLEAEVQAIVTAAGLRPILDGSGRLPAGLGEPGAEQPMPNATEQAVLLTAWEAMQMTVGP